MSKHRQWSRVACAVAWLGATQAGAHHSVAMYEGPEKAVMIQGTVKDFSWANPHVVLRMEVTSPEALAKGKLWTMELTAPGQLSRNGWTHSTLKAGDKVTVQVRPFRDGRAGGLFMSVRMPNGDEIKR
jgi:hypothetical protein